MIARYGRDRHINLSSERDAIIPTVGNRLLFAQSNNPLVRSLGQLSEVGDIVSCIVTSNSHIAV